MSIRKQLEKYADFSDLRCKDMAKAIIAGLKERAILEKHGRKLRDGGAELELTVILRKWRFPESN